uniref:ethanolamine kinase n=1 Tax=Oryctolagus cuniculus TaxID=9986 RepID=A0A5F9C5Q8_RABIT
MAMLLPSLWALRSGERTELLVDRENEVRNFQLLRAHGCAPKLYCTFQNGLCYEYMQGVALGPEHIREPRLFRLIALEMAKIHTIHTNGSLPKPTLWHKMHNYFTLVRNEINPSLSAGVPKVEVLEWELAWLKEHLSQLDSPVVFCHNDLLCKNIIYDSAKGHVRFIDYEYAGYNYQAFDIGNHFNEFAGVNEVDYCRYPARETQLQWLHYYLQAQKDSAVTPREVERLYVQVNKFALASHFFWALWALIQNQYSTIDFDFLRWVQGPAGREGGGKEELEAKASQTEGAGPIPCPQGRSAAPGRSQLPTLWPCSGPQHVAVGGSVGFRPWLKSAFPDRQSRAHFLRCLALLSACSAAPPGSQTQPLLPWLLGTRWEHTQTVLGLELRVGRMPGRWLTAGREQQAQARTWAFEVPCAADGLLKGAAPG